MFDGRIAVDIIIIVIVGTCYSVLWLRAIESLSFSKTINYTHYDYDD